MKREFEIDGLMFFIAITLILVGISSAFFIAAFTFSVWFYPFFIIGCGFTLMIFLVLIIYLDSVKTNEKEDECCE